MRYIYSLKENTCFENDTLLRSIESLLHQACEAETWPWNVD